MCSWLWRIHSLQYQYILGSLGKTLQREHNDMKSFSGTVMYLMGGGGGVGVGAVFLLFPSTSIILNEK